MKKTLLSAFALLALMSCGQSKSNDSSVDSSSMVKAEASVQVENDATAEVVEAPVEVFTTPDLALFDLQGHVKSCKKGNAVLKFDENGKLTSYKLADINMMKALKRKDNVIVKYGFDAGDEESLWYAVEWDAERVKHASEYNCEGAVEYDYKYGPLPEQNNKEVLLSTEQKGEGYNWSGTTTYTYEEFDVNGNWVKRTATDDLYCDYDEHNTSTGTTSETRTIEYYY